MYISSLEIDQIRHEYLEYLKSIKSIKIDVSNDLREKLEEVSTPLKGKLERKLEEVIRLYEDLFDDFIKKRIIYEMDRHFTEIFTEKDILCCFDDRLFHIFKKELGKLLRFNTENNIYESEKYKDFLSVLRKYYDDLNKILELKIGDIVKFIKMYVKLFEAVKEMKDYIYNNDIYYFVSAKKAGSIFKECEFNENDIAFFNEIVKKRGFSKILIFKDKIGFIKGEKKLMDISNDKTPENVKTLKNVYLLSGAYIMENRGTIFEVISYLYTRKILNRIKTLFLSTHNLLLKLRGSEEEIIDNINEKEIDIPIILHYEDKYIFILIECKFTYPSNDDIQRLNQLKKKLNDIPVDNEICILTANSNKILIKENIHIVSISKFEEWIKEIFN
jgi:hypothetical protein